MTQTELILANDTTEHWAARIRIAWRETVQGIFRVGELLAQAKDDPACRFDELQLPFKRRATYALMAVANRRWFRQVQYTAHLPASWATLEVLTRFDDHELDARFAAGEITPDLEQNTVRGWRKKLHREQRERDLAEKTTAVAAQLGTALYATILADPPWRFEPYSRDTGMDRSADNHYPTLPLEDIKALAIPAAADCVLFLWATVPMLPQALEVMTAWDFTYKSHFVWVKNNIGNGYWNRNKHELLLIGTRGDIPAPAPGDQYASVIEANIAEHSQKPSHFHEIIEDMFPNLPRIELFARQPRTGWHSWGNEVTP